MLLIKMVGVLREEMSVKRLTEMCFTFCEIL